MPTIKVWGILLGYWSNDGMAQPDEPFFLYSPPEKSAPWVLVIFGGGCRPEVFQYSEEFDARNALAMLTIEIDAQASGYNCFDDWE